MYLINILAHVNLKGRASINVFILNGILLQILNLFNQDLLLAFELDLLLLIWNTCMLDDRLRSSSYVAILNGMALLAHLLHCDTLHSRLIRLLFHIVRYSS
jgi:hypothetical protein